MSILALLVVLAIVGLIAWGLITWVPMPQGVKTVIVVVAVIACVIIALNAFGVHLPNPAVPHLR